MRSRAFVAAMVAGLIAVSACRDPAPVDPAAEAARRACARYAGALLWQPEDITNAEGEYETFVLRPVDGADGVAAQIAKDAAVARRAARFRELGEASDTLRQLLNGDRSEVGEADNKMTTACADLDSGRQVPLPAKPHRP